MMGGMLGHANPLLYADVRDPSHNRRRHGRLRCDDLRCSLGMVIDLSASGARVRTTGMRPPERGAQVTLSIEVDDATIDIPARVVRSSRTGLLHGEIAVEFIDVTPDIHAQLLKLARGIASNQSGLWSRGV